MQILPAETPFFKMKSSFLNLTLLGILTTIQFLSINPSHSQDFPFPSVTITNPRLLQAYIALQAWKLAIVSDPQGFTTNWVGPEVCSYTGVYCAPAPDDPKVLTVAGIDLNHANIAGFLPKELGLLKDLALFHLNSNEFCGTIPDSFIELQLLFELDLSNNLFSGTFPLVVLTLPSLKFLDIRYNKFFGHIPPELFDLKLDALFINNNKFVSLLPDNLGNSPVSVFVASTNFITGCIPPSVAQMGHTLEEMIMSNLELTGCFTPELGQVKELRVLDVSFNELKGPLSDSLGMLENLEQLNVAHNKLSGPVPASICTLPKLENFIYFYNYFNDEPPVCLRLPGNDDRENCIPGRPLQRSPGECGIFYALYVPCEAIHCL